MMVTAPNQQKFLDKVQALQDWRDPYNMVIGTGLAFF